MATIGGGTIKSYRFTRAWGVNPAEAAGTAVVDSAGGSTLTLEPGDYVNFSFDAYASFSGVVQQVGKVTSAEEGEVFDFTLLDNRLRLGQAWAWVIGAWNVVDDRFGRRVDQPQAPSGGFNSDSSGPGGGNDVDLTVGVSEPPSVPAASVTAPDRDNAFTPRRFKHLLPANARAGIWVYTDAPLTARQILNSAFGGAWADFSFSRNYHSSMNSVRPLGVDASSGMTLGSLVSQMCELCGVEVKLEGANSLTFARKGEGVLPLADSRTGTRNESESINPQPSKVRVLGDPFRVQVHNIGLVPDWKTGWEAWIDEASWIRKVGEVFELPAVTKADLAERAAFAKEVSVARFVATADLADLADYRRFGALSRMAMPAWDYIRNLVYRSYRIPGDYMLGGIPLASLKWSGGLLAGVEISGEGATTVQRLRVTNNEIYPDARAHVIVQGQPLDLIDARSIALFSQRRTRNLRDEWTEATDFEIDDDNFSIRFGAPVFRDGDPELGQSVLLRINAGEGEGAVNISGSVAAESDYLDVVVPNPDFLIEPAGVKLAVCFEFGRFQEDFGSGARRMVQPQAGLSMELIDTKNGSGGLGAKLGGASSGLLPFPALGSLILSELLYEDGEGASEKAAAVAEGLIQRETTQYAGGFPRYGVAGTSLTPVVDRVTVEIDAERGVVETVEFTKAKPTAAFLAERTLARLVRTGELFPGVEETRNEVRQLRLLAQLERRGGADRSAATHRAMADLWKRPVGGEHPSTLQIFDKNNAAPTRGEEAKWLAGDLVWADEKGLPSKTGKNFLGVMVSAPRGVGSKDLTIATRGIVPVRVRGGVAGGGQVMANPGDSAGGSTGSTVIGTLQHHESVPTLGSGEVLALVRLGAGGGGGVDGSRSAPLQLIDSRPAFYPEPSGADVADGYRRLWVRLGSCMGKFADNWGAHFDCKLAESGEAEGATPDTWFWAKIYLGAGTFVNVTHWEIVKGTTATAFENPPWPPGGTRPNVHYHPLGRFLAASGTLFNTGGGSLIVSENIVNIENGPRLGVPKITRGIYVQREGY